MSDSIAAPVPWYRQFWPWFLIALPATAVIAGLTTLWIAMDDPDGLVVGDYYKEGLAINERLARDEAARALGLKVHLSIDGGAVDARLQNELNLPALHLRLMHPTRGRNDIDVFLAAQPDGGFRGELPALSEGHWYLHLEPPDASWRLRGRLRVPGDAEVLLGTG